MTFGVLAALLLCAVSVWGQRIDGMVSNQQGAPVAGVLLRWVDTGGAASETRTGADGAYALDLVGVTAVGEVFGSGPTAHALGQNYPNPFNPGTTLPFALAVGGSVRLTIYNAMGQSVRVLLDGDLAAGRHEVRWDGRDAGGRPTAAGVYLYQLQAGGVVRQRKMLRVDGGMVPTGPRARPVLQARSYAVQLSGDHIVDEEIAVAVDGDSCVDFAVDERLLWTQRAPMPTPRQEVTAVTLDGRIYVFGGLDDAGGSIDVVEAYDPRRDSWERLGPMPRPLNHLAAASVDGLIYVLGGYVNFRSPLEISLQTLAYDPADGSWTRKADMPIAPRAHGTAVLDGRIYVVGGVSPGGGDRRAVMVYDPAADRWEVGSPMPVLSEHLAVAAADGMIYAISGRFGANRAGVHAYDPATAAWSERPAIPTARSGIAAAVWMGWIHVFGGEIPGVFAQHEVYDPTARVWAMAAPMPTARHGLASGVVDGKIYVIGGGTVAGLRATGVVEEYVP